MEITLNGEVREVVSDNIADLVAELGLEQRMLAVERNLEVVPKSAYAITALQAGDRIEIIHMVGGG